MTAGANGMDATALRSAATSLYIIRSAVFLVLPQSEGHPTLPANCAGDGNGRKARATSSRGSALEIRCTCGVCARLDRLPIRLRGWPDGYQLAMFNDPPFDRIWWWRALLPERKGTRCRVLARGNLNTALIEFEDGVKHVVSRHAFRKIPERSA